MTSTNIRYLAVCVGERAEKRERHTVSAYSATTNNNTKEKNNNKNKYKRKAGRNSLWFPPIVGGTVVVVGVLARGSVSGSGSRGWGWLVVPLVAVIVVAFF